MSNAVEQLTPPRPAGLEAHCQGILQRLRTPQGTTPRLVGVMSCRNGEGTSTIAAGLARTAAGSFHSRVLLVDANFAAPVQHRLFDLESRVGLKDVLENSAPWKGVAQAGVPHGLTVLTSGVNVDDDRLEIHSVRFQKLLDDIRNCFSLVIFDLPAVETGASAVALAAHLECVLVVVEAEKTRREVISRHCETLRRGGATPIGTVLNKRQNPIPEWVYQRL